MSDTEIARTHLLAALHALNDAKAKLPKRNSIYVRDQIFAHLAEAGRFITTARHYDPLATIRDNKKDIDADDLAANALYLEAALNAYRGADEYELADALQAIDKAILYKPNRSDLVLKKVEILIHMQRRDVALPLLHNLLIDDPGYIDAIRLRNKLQMRTAVGSGDPLPSTQTAMRMTWLTFLLWPGLVLPFIPHPIGLPLGIACLAAAGYAFWWNRQYDQVKHRQLFDQELFGKKDHEL